MQAAAAEVASVAAVRGTATNATRHWPLLAMGVVFESNIRARCTAFRNEKKGTPPRVTLGGT